MKWRLLIISTLIMLATGVSLRAENDKVIKGYCGGMMVHGGYVFGADYPGGVNINSGTFGLGGCAKVRLTKHFRTGFEGFFSKAALKKGLESGSNNKVFWAGALADWIWECGKIYPYVGATVGGGTETAFYLFQGDKHDWEKEDHVVFHKQPFFALDPYVGLEYAVGRALRLTVRADWLITINSGGLNRPTGPRLYFGVVFSH